MRNFFLTIALVSTSALFSCNDNADKVSDATEDSTNIETSMDTSNKAMQADTALKQKMDTAAVKPAKPSNKKK